MSKAKWSSLVDLLLERTKESTLDWTIQMPSEPEVRIGSRDIRIKKSQNYSGSELYIIIISDSFGMIIDEFSDEDLTTVHSAGGNYFEKMVQLYKIAFRSATGADDVLDDLIGRLSDDEAYD